MDAKTGRPVEAFRIGSVEGTPIVLGPGISARLQGTHSEDGAFRIENVPLDEASIVVVAKDYMPAFYPVSLNSAAHLDDVKIALEIGNRLHGRVVNELGGPVSNAIVLQGDAPKGVELSPSLLADIAAISLVQSDENGQFEVSGLPPGMARLSAVHVDQGIGSTPSRSL